MKSAQVRVATLAAALGAVAALSACHDDQTAAPAPVQTNTENFSTFAINAFNQGENTPPASVDSITLIADADSNPAAFNALLM